MQLLTQNTYRQTSDKFEPYPVSYLNVACIPLAVPTCPGVSDSRPRASGRGEGPDRHSPTSSPSPDPLLPPSKKLLQETAEPVLGREGVCLLQ